MDNVRVFDGRYYVVAVEEISGYKSEFCVLNLYFCLIYNLELVGNSVWLVVVCRYWQTPSLALLSHSIQLECRVLFSIPLSNSSFE